MDDHDDIRDLVGDYLEAHGYRVTRADGGRALREVLARGAPDLVVLDVMMPGEDGLTLCRDIRAAGTLPVIFLTAVADDLDRIIGLEVGADDYLVKPFNPRELLARIRAVLRRSGGGPLPSAPEQDTVDFGPWRLDRRRRELTGSDGVSVALSTAEFRLLQVFLDHPGHVLSRDRLLDLTVGRSSDPFDRSIDNQVSRLRRKLGDDPRNPTMILTHWGGGYSLCAELHRP
ncbi:response regulator [Frigidibacter sp. MR17.24]|uniref:response regulator n=1 Tax=Frigidibacter sp. MR17.24 TaxID=3127345 RepID=UPI003012B9CF